MTPREAVSQQSALCELCGGVKANPQHPRCVVCRVLNDHEPQRAMGFLSRRALRLWMAACVGVGGGFVALIVINIAIDRQRSVAESTLAREHADLMRPLIDHLKDRAASRLPIEDDPELPAMVWPASTQWLPAAVPACGASPVVLTAQDWASRGWKKVGFQMPGPTMVSVRIERVDRKMMVFSRGDLDCDGRLEEVSFMLHVTEGRNVYETGPSLFEATKSMGGALPTQ